MAPPDPPPDPVPEFEILDDPPRPPALPADTPAEPLPDDAFADDIPVVGPARMADLPEARPFPRRGLPDPPRPKPQVGLAMAVVVLLTAAVVVGLAVIGVALWAGFKSVSKPRKADAPAASREGAAVPSPRSAAPRG